MTSGHPIVIRRAEPADAEAIHQTFLGPRVIAGTLQLPYPSLEMWRKRLAEVPADDYILVATIAGEVIGSLGLHAASKSPRRRHVGALGMSVRDGIVGWRGMVGSVLMQRMLEEHDFALIEPAFFTTSNVGGEPPAIGKRVGALKHGHDLAALELNDVIVTCQGADYTTEVYPK